MKRSMLALIFLWAIWSMKTMAAQCEVGGRWYPYDSPECSGDQSATADGGPTIDSAGPDSRIAERHMALVRGKMKDPESVVFSAVRSSKEYTCGSFNAKNSYGAYAGSESFLVLDFSGSTHVLTGNDVFGTMVKVNGVFLLADRYASECFALKVVIP